MRLSKTHPYRLTHLCIVALFCFAAWQPVSAQTPEESPAVDRAALVKLMRRHAQPLAFGDRDYDALLESIGAARIVMLGEGTHGSAEFVAERGRLTRRLIAEQGFGAVVLEAAWAPTLHLDAYIRGRGPAPDAATALRVYRRFPRWTWRNREFAAVLDQFKAHNAARPPGEAPVALYGFDLYESPQAIANVLAYLRRHHPNLLPQARRAYRCFAPYTAPAIDPQLYGRDVARGTMPRCDRRIAAMQAEMARIDAAAATPESFAAMMSARAVTAAEAYYRILHAPDSDESSWNLRERYLADTLDILLARHGKIVVWAHNIHQGDARATDQALVDERSIGQLMRERHGEAATYLIGLTSHAGTVHAASGWATRDTTKTLRPAQAESWPALFHEVGVPAFVLDLRRNPTLAEGLDVSIADRAIGVTYLPEDEPRSHYFKARMGRRYDALIHIDRTTALHPLN